jgi:hypothetical protein
MRTRNQEKEYSDKLIVVYKSILGLLQRGTLWHEAFEVSLTALEVDQQARDL